MACGKQLHVVSKATFARGSGSSSKRSGSSSSNGNGSSGDRAALPRSLRNVLEQRHLQIKREFEVEGRNLRGKMQDWRRYASTRRRRAGQ